MLRVPSGLPVIVANTAKTTRCTKFCASMLHILCKWWFLVSKQCGDFLFHSAVNIKAQFSDMIPNLANIMHFADVSLHCCKILSDGNAPCNELMLHHTMQCTGASCKMLQIPSNFAANIAQPRDSKSKRAKDCTQILSHRGAFIKTCFYTFAHTHAFTRGWFYTQIPSGTGVVT